jgi:replication fork protection complex subunit Csm3/Swi3
MKGLRETFYPPAKSPTPTSPIRDGSPSPVREAEDEEEGEGRERSQGRSSEPLFTDGPDEEGPDMDELIAMEEMERDIRPQQGAGSQGESGRVGSGEVPPVLEEEDEWEGLYD